MLTRTDNDAFGFGSDALGTATDTPPKVVTSAAALRTEIANANSSDDPTLITIAGGEYIFNDEVLDITGKRITIRRQTDASVVLRNVQFYLHLDTIDQIVLRGLAFRSDGEADDARDAILMQPTENAAAPGMQANARVRITHCTFDGYYDIAIDTHNKRGFPLLLATIDHCYFFDAHPGQPTDKVNGLPAFVNRGAINIGDDGHMPARPGEPLSHSYVTVAYNVFANVWRRCPRISNGSFGHVFNNLLYRWGTGNYEDKDKNNTSSWRGITIGGSTDNEGRALVEANRFIPDPLKAALATSINVERFSLVDVTSGVPNRFDDENGRPRTDATFTQPPDSVATLFTEPFDEVNSTRPPATDPNELDWENVVSQAGPRGGLEARTDAQARSRKMLLHVLDLAQRPPQ